MRILFDQGTPFPLRTYLKNHQVDTAFRRGWADYSNGALIAASETHFDLLITTDKNLKYQQNLSGRRIAILVLPTTNWPELRMMADSIVSTVDKVKPGDYVEL